MTWLLICTPDGSIVTLADSKPTTVLNGTFTQKKKVVMQNTEERGREKEEGENETKSSARRRCVWVAR
jgi:hypothetical protein